MSDEERDLRKYSRRSAIGLMGVGGGLAATETLGFTNLTADRGVNVGVVTDDDENATLRITDDTDDDPIAGKTFDDSVQIDIENNSGSELTAEDDDLVVTVDAVAGDEGLDVTSNDFDDDGTISNGSGSITLELKTDTEDRETVSFTLATQDSGGDVTVDIRFDATFNGTSLTATREDIMVNDNTG